MPIFESSDVIKEETSKADSESEIKVESKSAEHEKKVAEDATPKAETLPAKDESLKKEFAEISETGFPSVSVAKSEGKLITGVVESVKKTVEVFVITNVEEVSATEKFAEISTIKEPGEAIAEAESDIKIEKAVVVESDISSAQQESRSNIAVEKTIVEESNVESNLVKDGTAGRDENVASQGRATTENLQLETAEKETTRKEAELGPSCLVVGSSEWMYEDPQKIADAMAMLDEPYLYDGHQTKRIDIPAPDFDYVSSHADPRMRKMADCFECSVDVAIFNWSNISLHVVDDKINIACRQERESSNGHEFHDMYYLFPIPVDANKDGITVCITANRRLVVRMPIKTTEK